MAYIANGISMTNNVSAVVTYSGVDTNLSNSPTLSGLSYNSSTGTFTNTSGATQVYCVSYYVCTNFGATTVQAWISANGTLYGRTGNHNNVTAMFYLSSSAIITLANNSWLNIGIYQSSGATQLLYAGSVQIALL